MICKIVRLSIVHLQFSQCFFHAVPNFFYRFRVAVAFLSIYFFIRPQFFLRLSFPFCFSIFEFVRCAHIFASSLMKSFHIKFRVIDANVQNSMFANGVCSVTAASAVATAVAAAAVVAIVVFADQVFVFVDLKTTLINNYGKFFSS